MMSGFYSSNDATSNEARAVVHQMSVDDLKKLMSSDDEVTKLVRNLTEVQRTEAEKEVLKGNIKRLAQRNLDKEPLLIREKQKLAELHHEAGRINDKYKSLAGSNDEQATDTNPDVIWALMQSAAADLDRATEQTAEDFFYGEKTEDEVTSFERRFIEDRKRAHELKIKAEKFHELLQMSQSTSYLNSGHYPRSGGYQ